MGSFFRDHHSPYNGICGFDYMLFCMLQLYASTTGMTHIATIQLENWAMCRPHQEIDIFRTHFPQPSLLQFFSREYFPIKKVNSTGQIITDTGTHHRIWLVFIHVFTIHVIHQWCTKLWWLKRSWYGFWVVSF